MTSAFTKKRCVPCEGGTKPISGEPLAKDLQELGGDWKCINEHHLEKEFFFKNFAEALAFTNKVGTLAEDEGHHPDFHLGWGYVRIILWTHTINGISENDFILGAKIDALT